MEQLVWAINNLKPLDIVDILIVALVFYGASFLFRGTQAVPLLRGTLILFVGLSLITSILNLDALRWLLTNILTVMAVAIPVIFQPELRQALARLGRGGVILNRQTPESLRAAIIDAICQAAERLSERRHGALIVLQRTTSLKEYVRTGIPLDSEVNAELMLTIFWPKTELHDGAAVINNNGRISAASVVLPLSASRNLPNKKMGTRHRAALGISEVSDAICIVVSEETGKIAVTNGGRMVSRLDADRLRTILNAFYGPDRRQAMAPWDRVRVWSQSLVGRWLDWRKST